MNLKNPPNFNHLITVQGLNLRFNRVPLPTFTIVGGTTSITVSLTGLITSGTAIYDLQIAMKLPAFPFSPLQGWLYTTDATAKRLSWQYEFAPHRLVFTLMDNAKVGPVANVGFPFCEMTFWTEG